jgi:CheY-like chemotaxis protein
MAKILVVDDSVVDAQLAAMLLRMGDAGHSLLLAGGGVEAMEIIEREHPAIVVTDLQMPEMDGLRLVEAVRRDHPDTPVILMTAHGSEEVAAEALRRGAASYVPKRFLARDLLPTVDRVLTVAGHDAGTGEAVRCLEQSESRFVLDGRLSLIPAVVRLLRQDLSRIRFCDQTAQMRVAVALDEALNNAVQHGNLEVGSDVREKGLKDYVAILESRRGVPPYRDRRVFLSATLTRERAVYVVRDEGPGFDVRGVPDPTSPQNLGKISGRGLLLIRSFMDEVRHNETGNEITMVKLKDPAPGGAA